MLAETKDLPETEHTLWGWSLSRAEQPFMIDITKVIARMSLYTPRLVETMLHKKDKVLHEKARAVYEICPELFSPALKHEFLHAKDATPNSQGNSREKPSGEVRREITPGCCLKAPPHYPQLIHINAADPIRFWRHGAAASSLASFSAGLKIFMEMQSFTPSRAFLERIFSEIDLHGSLSVPIWSSAHARKLRISLEILLLDMPKVVPEESIGVVMLALTPLLVGLTLLESSAHKA